MRRETETVDRRSVIESTSVGDHMQKVTQTDTWHRCGVCRRTAREPEDVKHAESCPEFEP